MQRIKAQEVSDGDIFGNDIRRGQDRQPCRLCLKSRNPQSLEYRRKQEKISRSEPAGNICHHTGKIHFILKSLFPHMRAQHFLVFSLADQHQPRIRHLGYEIRHNIDGELLVFLEMKAAYTDDNIFVTPVCFPARLPAELFSSGDTAPDLFHIDGVADHYSGMTKLTLPAFSCIEPFGCVLGTGPEIRGISAQSSPVRLVEHAAQLCVHVLRIVAVDDPLGDPVFPGHFQIINVCKTVDIDPDGLVLSRMLYKK